METNSVTSAPARPGFPFRWLFSWRIARRVLLAFAVLATLWAVFVAEENWRCKRDWENYKRAKQAAGDWREWDEFVPPPVPDDDNLFAAPHIAAAFTKNSKDSFAEQCQNKFNAALTNAMRLDYPAAELVFVLPGEATPAGVDADIIFSAADSRERVERLIEAKIGLHSETPKSATLFVHQPESSQRLRIATHTKRIPTLAELEQVFPKKGWPTARNYVAVKLEGRSALISLKFSSPGWCQATDYLQASAANEPFYELMDAALQRPKVRMNGDYSIPWNINIPNFVRLRNIAQELAARAQCHFLLGQPDAAVRELARMKRLERFTIEQSPMTLVSAMINVAIHGLYAHTVADGFRLGVWQDAQLKELQKQIGNVDIIAPVKLALGMERVAINHSCDRWRTNPEEYVRAMGFTISINQGSQKLSFKQMRELAVLRAIPTGWYYQNQLVYNQTMDSMPLKNYNETTRIVQPGSQPSTAEQMDALARDNAPYARFAKNYLTMLAIPNFTRAVQTAAYNQTLLNQARIACALERYRIAQGEYPAALDTLAPQFMEKIPHDIIGGEPLKYRRTTDGKFLLYSIGWNEKDDGGKIIRDKEGRNYIAAVDSDWVWSTEIDSH